MYEIMPGCRHVKPDNERPVVMDGFKVGSGDEWFVGKLALRNYSISYSLSDSFPDPPCLSCHIKYWQAVGCSRGRQNVHVSGINWSVEE